jgi:hypothetical protein
LPYLLLRREKDALNLLFLLVSYLQMPFVQMAVTVNCYSLTVVTAGRRPAPAQAQLFLAAAVPSGSINASVGCSHSNGA